MAIEIGSLVVRGTFGPPKADAADQIEQVHQDLAVWRREILDQVQDMIAEADRRRRDR